MDQNGSNTPKKLASAAELRGKKAGSSEKKSSGGKMWLSLILLVVVLAGAIGVYFLSGIIKPEDAAQPQATLPPSKTVKIIGRDRKDVASVTIQLKGREPYTVVQHIFETESGPDAEPVYGYSIEGLPDFSLNQTKSSSLTGYAANLTALQQIAENVTDFAAYGLDEPTSTITMKYTDGKEVVWLMGSKAPTSTAHYMCEKGSRTVFLVYKTACEAFGATLEDMYVLKMPVAFDDTTVVTNLLIEQKGKPTIELVQLDEVASTFSMSKIKLVQPVEYDAQSERAIEMLDASTYLGIAGYAGELSNLPEAGLDDPRARIRVTDAQGNVLHYVVGNYNEEGMVYVKVDDTDTVYLAEAKRLAFLENANVAYLVEQFTNLVLIDKVDAVTVTAGEEAYTLSIERQADTDEGGSQKTDANGNPAYVSTYFFDGVETSEKEFKDAYMEIIGMMISKMSDNYQLEGEVVAQIKYTLNVEPYEFVVEYLEYDGDYYAVRRDGLTLFLIKQDRVKDMVELIKGVCSIAD